MSDPSEEKSEKNGVPEQLLGNRNMLMPVEEFLDQHVSYEDEARNDLQKNALHFVGQIVSQPARVFDANDNYDESRKNVDKGLQKLDLTFDMHNLPEALLKSDDLEALEEGLRAHYNVPKKPAPKIPDQLKGNSHLLLHIDDLSLTHRGVSDEDIGKAKSNFTYKDGPRFVGQMVTVDPDASTNKRGEKGVYKRSEYCAHPWSVNSGNSGIVREALQEMGLDYGMVEPGALNLKKGATDEEILGTIRTVFEIKARKPKAVPKRNISQEDKDYHSSISEEHVLYIALNNEFLRAAIDTIEGLREKATAVAYRPAQNVLKQGLKDFAENYNPGDNLASSSMERKPAGGSIRIGINDLFATLVKVDWSLAEKAQEAGREAVIQEVKKQVRQFIDNKANSLEA